MVLMSSLKMSYNLWHYEKIFSIKLLQIGTANQCSSSVIILGLILDSRNQRKSGTYF